MGPAVPAAGRAASGPYDRGVGAYRESQWSSAVRVPGGASANWKPGQDPEAVAVEVLFVDEHGRSYVISAIGPDARSAVAAAEKEARRYCGCESATDWQAA